jgi:TolB-like protein
MNFIAELRKRNVFRAMAAYLVGAWIMVQVSGFVADAAEMPPWIDSFILIVVLLGLPIVGIAAWALELTPDGIKPSGTETEMAPRPIGPVDYVLIAAVVVVVGLFGWQQFMGPRATPSITEVRIVTSIAVMPFVAISSEANDVILGDGLAEELLNVLAQFPELSVAGRTSSFAFRDQAEDIPAIGEALGVSHVLEGSVRRSDEQLRVTAQLIRVSDGFHIWSGNFDRPFADILKIQDEIVRHIAQVMTIRLGVTAYDVDHQRAANPSAYEQYLRGRVLWAERHDGENRTAAIEAFQTTVDIDPGFADGWAALARALAYSGVPDGYTQEEVDETIREAAERALQLDPDNAEAMVALSNWHSNVTRNWVEAKVLTDRAIEIAPNAAFTHYNAVINYEYFGDREMIASSARRALALDPLNLTIQSNVAERYMRMGRFGEARRLLENSQLDDADRDFILGNIAYYERDADEMSEVLGRAVETLREQDPDFEDFGPALEHFIAAIAAAFRGDEEDARARLPAIEAAAENESLSIPSPADLLYLLGDYAEAARRYREIYESGEGFGDSDHVAINLPFDVGLLCQPDYHAIWALPEWAGLVEIRRANGATGNLPLEGPECDEYLEAAE